MVQVLAMAGGGIVFSPVALHSFYNSSVIAAVLLIIMLLLISATQFKSLKLPPGPWGVPVFGYLPFLGKVPHQHLAKLAEKHGPIMYIQLGSFPGLVVSSPRLAKEVLMVQDPIFASHPKGLAVKQLSTFIKDGETIEYGMTCAKLGAYFRNLRRLVESELMSPKRLQSLQGLRNEELHRMMESVLDDANAGEGNVNLMSAISAMTMNVISRTVLHKRFFGKDLDNQREAREYQKLFHMIVKWVGCVFVADFVPSVRPLTRLLFSDERVLAKLAKQMDAFIEPILQEHRLKHNTEESSQDFMDMMLTSPGEDGKYLDDNSIKVLSMELLMAGTDSPTPIIEWTVAELLRHPKVMQRLQHELDTVIGNTRHVQESDVPDLPYLHAVVKETLRLHPGGPLLIPRESSQQTKIDGYDIPANTRVFINVWAMGRDSSIWENPTEFNPDRFMERSHIDYEGQQFEFLPFGSGRRRCPGLRLGSLLLNLIVARVVHDFDISLPDGMHPMDLDMSEGSGIFLSMRVPLSSVRVRPRLPLDLYQHLATT